MKFYKPEYWSGMQSIETLNESDRLWDLSAQEYLTQLEGLKTRLTARNYNFFRHDSLHDGYVVNIHITNQNTLKMKDEGCYRNIRTFLEPMIINIDVLSREYIYSLKFSKVSRFSFESPEEQLLPGSSGIGDWGYAELTEVNNKVLSYEVLFSSGTTLLIEFSGFSFSRKRFIK